MGTACSAGQDWVIPLLLELPNAYEQCNVWWAPRKQFAIDVLRSRKKPVDPAILELVEKFSSVKATRKKSLQKESRDNALKVIQAWWRSVNPQMKKQRNFIV